MRRLSLNPLTFWLRLAAAPGCGRRLRAWINSIQGDFEGLQRRPARSVRLQNVLHFVHRIGLTADRKQRRIGVTRIKRILVLQLCRQQLQERVEVIGDHRRVDRRPARTSRGARSGAAG